VFTAIKFAEEILRKKKFSKKENILFDLDLTSNIKLQGLFAKRPNICQPKLISLKYNFKILMDYAEVDTLSE